MFHYEIVVYNNKYVMKYSLFDILPVMYKCIIACNNSE